MKQWICNADAGIAAATRIMSVMGRSTPNTDILSERIERRNIWCTAGTLRNLRVVVDAAPGVGNSVTWTIEHNAVDTALAVTISGTDTTGQNTANTITLADGDEILLRRTITGTPTDTTQTWTVEFDADEAGASCYSNDKTALSDLASRFRGLYTSRQGTTAASISDVISCNGTITKMRAKLSGDVIGGGSYEFYIYKNGVKQDGTGGTVDTKVEIPTGDEEAASSFSLPATAGDTFYWEAVPVGTVNVRDCGFCTEFIADVDGESMFCAQTSGNIGSTDTRYIAPPLEFSPSTIETDGHAFIRCGVTSFTLQRFYAIIDGTPGAGNNYIFTTRRNETTPTGALTITIADSATAGNDLTGGLACVTDDRVSLQLDPNSTPSSRLGAFSVVVRGGIAFPPKSAAFVGTIASF
jgi:hypothetical protein